MNGGDVLQLLAAVELYVQSIFKNFCIIVDIVYSKSFFFKMMVAVVFVFVFKVELFLHQEI